MVAITRPRPEIWTGAVEQLPSSRDALEPELFADLELAFEPSTGVAVLNIAGLIDQPRWLKIATTINQLVADGAPSLVVRISSRAQVAKGAGLAFIAMQDASSVIPRACHIEGTGALGAAMTLASFAREVFVDSDDNPPLGGLVAKAVYSRATKNEKQLANDIQRVLRHLAPRDRTRGYAETLVAMVHADRITRPRAEAVLKHLNHVGTSNQ